MSRVNDLPAEAERHVAVLLGGLLGQIRDVFLDEDWDGLRSSHFRVISHVPPEGISVTDLAGRLHMTKQGCGQFVNQLVGTGHLASGTDPADRRVRVVRRTTHGDRATADVTARLARLEEEWRAEVGDRRYTTFRRVLEHLATR